MDDRKQVEKSFQIIKDHMDLDEDEKQLIHEQLHNVHNKAIIQKHTDED